MKGTKITVNSKELLKALKKVAPAKMDSKVAYGIMCYKAWVFEISKCELHIKTCDALQVYMEVDVEMAKEAEGVEGVKQYAVASTEMKKLMELVDEEPVELTFYNSQAEIKTTRGEYYIPLMDVNEWKPIVEGAEEAVKMTVEVPDFKKWLGMTAICMTDDMLRPAMDGVTIDVRKIGKGVSVVATDGRILSRIKVVTAEVSEGGCGSYIIPAKVVKILQRVLPSAGWLDMELSEKAGIMTVDDLEIRFRPIDGRFPDYTKVIPSEGLYDLRVNRADLLHLVQRLRLFASESGKLEFSIKTGEQKMTVKAVDLYYELKGQEEIDVRYKKMPESDGMYRDDKFMFGLNAKRMEKLLNAIRVTDILIRIKSNNAGFLIQDAADKSDVNEWQYLVMPMVIDEN